MSIQGEISSWDGKSAIDIDAIYKRHGREETFPSEVIKLIEQEPLQKGATWLLKRHLENGGQFTKNQVKKIYAALPKLGQWESKLHVLQCMPSMPIPEPGKKMVEAFLRKCLADENKFIRAWAYNGFYELSMQYPEHKEETKQFFEMAMRDEAPSVKSRIRNIKKRGVEATSCIKPLRFPLIPPEPWISQLCYRSACAADDCLLNSRCRSSRIR